MLVSSGQILVPEWGAEVSKKNKDLETIKRSREQPRNNGSDGKDDDND